MPLTLPNLAVAFAAFCVWLAVRVINRKERWAKWTLIAVLGLPVLYVASFGPACWWLTSLGPTYGNHNFPWATEAAAFSDANSRPRVANLYWPVGWMANRAPRPFFNAMRWYATLRLPYVIVPADYDGQSWIAM